MTQSTKAQIIQWRRQGFNIYEIREMLGKIYSTFEIAIICDHAKIMTNQRRRFAR